VSSTSRFRRAATPLICAALASVLVVAPGPQISAASAQTAPAAARVREPADPLEGLNRGLYAVHRQLDKALIRPLMLVYTGLMPDLLRAGVRNAVGNLGEPITFVNDVLTVRPRRASRTVTRFATNSTIGLLGLFDFAADAGYPRHTSDFGQTLARYGVGPGPYLFIPILGPSTLRDTTGRVVDSYADPVRMFHYKGDTAVRIARPVVAGLELRSVFDSDIQALDTTATDPYVTLRSAFLQNRQSFIQDGQVDVDALPSFTPEPAAPAPETTPAPVPVAAAQPGPVAVARVRDTFFRSYQ
jgi:phospholipid-binding lipoprotein MlaA